MWVAHMLAHPSGSALPNVPSEAELLRCIYVPQYFVTASVSAADPCYPWFSWLDEKGGLNEIERWSNENGWFDGGLPAGGRGGGGEGVEQ